MGHPKSFPLKFVAIGNEDCDEEFYQGKVRFLTYETIKNLFSSFILVFIKILGLN